MNPIWRTFLIFLSFFNVTSDVARASEVELSPPATLSQKFDSRQNLESFRAPSLDMNLLPV